MADLRTVFEELGFRDVTTYINSGNVIFTSENKPNVAGVEKSLIKNFGHKISVLIMSAESLQAITRAIPASWQNDTEQKSDVLYLFDDIDTPDIIEKIGPNAAYETILHVPGALLSNVKRTFQTRSSIVKLIGTPLYKRMTVRNVNTARKLANLCA